MKIKILFLASLLFAGSAWQEQDNPYRKCDSWNHLDEGEKIAFVFGWLMGVENSVLLTKETISLQLWPTGLTVGMLLNEINVLCQRAENKNADLGAIIKRIASEKNR